MTREPVEYRLYLDDSGTKEYSKAGHGYSAKGVTRYFVFGGILITADNASRLAEDIANLKKQYFGTPNVEIKSNWLRVPHERKARYTDRFTLSEEQLTEFVDEFYKLVEAANLRLIAAVVDKEHMSDQYGANAWYAPAVAYELLAQRMGLEIHPPDTVQVTIDDMSGATPYGHQYKANLRQHHKQLRANGSRLKKGLRVDCLGPDLRFDNSATSHLIQAADIVAYNVYRQFVDHGDAWEDVKLKSLPTYEWFNRVVKKFVQSAEGRVQGYGIVKFPLKKQVRWRVE